MATGEELSSFFLDMAEHGSDLDRTQEHLIPKLDKELNSWKTVPVNIAVVGNSGVGKSAFVNALLGLKANDQKAAKVDVVECTKTISKYPHPNNDKLVFWDIPGMGTEDFPAETYREKIKMSTYDFFVIMSAQRFTENDVKLAKMIKEIEKNFFFVRSQVDIDIQKQSICDDHIPRKITEDKVLKKIKEDINSRLKLLGMQDQKYFLVNNYNVEKYDFPDLIEAAQSGLNDHQKTVVALSCTHFTSHSLIEQRFQEFQNRIPIVATKYGLVLLDSSRREVIADEINMYREQLGFNIKQKNLVKAGKAAALLEEHFKQIRGKVRRQTVSIIYSLLGPFKSIEKYEKATKVLDTNLNSLRYKADENIRMLCTLTTGKGNS